MNPTKDAHARGRLEAIEGGGESDVWVGGESDADLMTLRPIGLDAYGDELNHRGEENIPLTPCLPGCHCSEPIPTYSGWVEEMVENTIDLCDGYRGVEA